MLSIRKVWQ